MLQPPTTQKFNFFELKGWKRLYMFTENFLMFIALLSECLYIASIKCGFSFIFNSIQRSSKLSRFKEVLLL